MNLPDMPLFDVLKEQMSWLSQLKSLLSQNVANSDTPGYAAIDLKPADFAHLVKGSAEPNVYHGGLTVTDPHHIVVSRDNSGGFETQSSGDPESNPTGNSVSIEEEMMKVADTQAQYQAASNIYAKAVSMMRTAIDRSGS
jgi:flagellar basal-body rod protein FlgB